MYIKAMKKINLYAIILLLTSLFVGVFVWFNSPTSHQSVLYAIASNTQNTNPLGVGYENAFPNLSFKRPVAFVQAPGQPEVAYVVEQSGRIYVFRSQPDSKEKNVFLDIREHVDDNTNEEGLLGLAFHPDFKENGYFYVNYTTNRPNLTRISRFSLSRQNPMNADPASEVVLLTYPQPYWNHNGGGLAFGPDGYLYIGVGDGGSGGDPKGNGQNLRTLLGSILRIDVNTTQSDKKYRIPSDNPFYQNTDGFKEEIFAYGLRNPWRFSFDSQTGKLWVGDVGQNAYEEIDVVENGNNYGWNSMEGTHCFRSKTCQTANYAKPVWEYGRSDGSSVTGGYVYRGEKLPQLAGKYVYADFVSHSLWALDVGNANEPHNIRLFKDKDLKISSFGVDLQQELYMCSFDGNIYRLAVRP